VLYVLDEPSVGLHARDNTRLLAALRNLVTLGNSYSSSSMTETRFAAPITSWNGPGAGVHGGNIVAQEPEQIIASPSPSPALGFGRTQTRAAVATASSFQNVIRVVKATHTTCAISQRNFRSG